jgi:hypothetical protein
MIQSRRNRVYSVDARLFLYEEGYGPLLNELRDILDEEVADFNNMPEGLQDSGRGSESRDAQVYLQKAIKALTEVTDRKRISNGKMQELMDEIHSSLRSV